VARVPARTAWTRLSVLGWCAAACSSCFGPSFQSKRQLQTLLASRDFDGAAALIRHLREGEYGRRNAVLYHLDMGMVLLDAGKYKESDASFDKAERRMDELYTRSVSRAFGTLALHDAVTDYSGDPFERALMNAFRAINYTMLGKPDEALVEVRKAEGFLQELDGARSRKLAYRDDAFVRYLDSLLYADAGKADDARISREAAHRAYAAYAKEYGTSPPAFALEEDAQAGELVFIHGAGIAPRKFSRTFQVAWNEASAIVQATPDPSGADEELSRAKGAIIAGLYGNAVTVSFPEYAQDNYDIAASVVRVADASAPTQLVEDVSKIARRELSDHLAVVRTRAIARAAVKHILTNVSAAEAEKRGGKWARWLTETVLSIAAAATEAADTRSWNTLPAQIRMARLRLPPGTRSVEILLQSATGEIIDTHVFSNVTLSPGKRTYLYYRTVS